MAGNYPDVPSWRMPWDRDGTQAFYINSSGAISEIASTSKQYMNNEDNNGYGLNPSGGTGIAYVVFIFPEQRDIDAFYLNFIPSNTDYGHYERVEVSPNSTTGLDGTWTTVSGLGIDEAVNLSPAYRLGIDASTVLGIKAVRVVFRGLTSSSSLSSMTFRAMHMYGERIPGATPDRLELWHPTLDQRIGPAYFDFGNSPRASSADKTFRVKNLSSTLTAQSVRVAMEILTDANPALLGQHALSVDGANWLPQLNVGDLAPGQMSQIVTLRRTLVDTAQLGVYAFRVFAESTSAWV